MGAREDGSQCFAKSRQASWHSCGYSLGCRSNQSCLQRGRASQGRKSGKIFFGTAGGNKPACPTLTPKMVSTGAVREREGEPQAPCGRGGAGTRGQGALSQPAGTPRLAFHPEPPNARPCLCQDPVSGTEEKLMTKVICGWRGDVQGEARVRAASSEGGVHPPVELYDFERLVPLQVSAD